MKTSMMKSTGNLSMIVCTDDEKHNEDEDAHQIGGGEDGIGLQTA